MSPGHAGWEKRDPQMIYEHGEPTGHTSWGPDPKQPQKYVQLPDGEWVEDDSANWVPEPTEAMVEAAEQESLKALPGGKREQLKAAIAAAPPEWLLRAALSEEELTEVLSCMGYAEQNTTCYGDPPKPHFDGAEAKISRALRGGEET